MSEDQAAADERLLFPEDMPKADRIREAMRNAFDDESIQAREDAWYAERFNPPVPEPCREYEQLRVAYNAAVANGLVLRARALARQMDAAEPRRKQVADGIEEDTRTIFGTNAEFITHHEQID